MRRRIGWTLWALLALAAPAQADLKKDIEFARPGGVSLTLDAFVPDGKGPFPTAILVHGGGFTGGTKNHFITPLFQPLSDARFTWFTINYRLAPAHRYPACVEDVETAIRWVKDHAAEYKVDKDRIALIGESAGGHLVSLAGARGKGKTRVAAVVPFYAPHDLEFQADSRKALGPSLSALLGLSAFDDAAREALRSASPSRYVRPGMPPYLLVHGTEDEQVPYAQSVRFRELLNASKNRCDLITIPNGRHGMGSWESFYPQYKTLVVEWLQRHLR